MLGENIILHIYYKEVKEPTEVTWQRETQIIEILQGNPKITLQEVAAKIGKSLRTVKTTVKVLQEKGIISRSGGKKKGCWIVNKKKGE